MPIVHMVSNNQETYPEGTYCPFGPGSWNEPERRRDTSPIVLHESHHGLCLFETERNFYDDSDFYMTVWDPEQQCTKRLMFATTRGWCYPCFGSSPDATPEVKEVYEKWRAERDRRNRIQYRWDQRKKDIELAKQCRLDGPQQLRRLRGVLSEESFDRIFRLLKTKNFRSNFRKDLDTKVRQWLAEEDPKYATPLSYRQINALY